MTPMVLTPPAPEVDGDRAGRKKLWLALLLLGLLGAVGLALLLGVGGANAVGSCGGPQGGQSRAAVSVAPSPAGR